MTKQIVSAILWVLFSAIQTAPTPTTYFIRPDGGTRYTAARVTAGMTAQCDGKHDQSLAAAQSANPGTSTNLPCAFNDYRFMWDDQTYNNDAWVMAGGDTLIIRGCASGQNNTAPTCRVGYDANTGSGAGYTWCLGGGTSGCSNPTIPAGTAAQHTRILGQNFAACSTGTALNKSAMTQIIGGFGLWTPMNLAGAQFLDVECIEVTSHASCIWFGSPALPSGCSGQNPVADYDSDGVRTDVNTHDLLLQDMWIHGHVGRGIKGPIGGIVTCLRCDISTNGAAGWDFDDGNATPMGAGSMWNFLYSTIEWSGCNQEYPAVDPIPVATCYSQSTGGYGDGVGTPAGTGLSVNIDHSIFRNNTQDGLDLGHVDTGGPYTLSITNSIANSNNGGQFKWGPQYTSATFTDNVAIADCMRMKYPITGTPAAYNANLSDFCRADGELAFNFRNSGTASLKQNTFIGYAGGGVMFDIQCWDASTTECPLSMLDFENNIILGYDNPATYNSGGQAGGPAGIYVSAGTFATPWPTTQKNNAWWTIRNYVGVTGDIYADPLFVNEPTGNGANFQPTQLDNFNIALTAGSPAIGWGANPSVTPPPTTPTLTSIAVTPPTAFAVSGSPEQFACTATLSDGSQSACVSPVWLSSNAGIASVSSAGLATGILPGTATIAASIGSVSGAAVLTVSPTVITTGGVTITPAQSVTITNAHANNGHVSFFLSSTQSTTALATVAFNSELKYISCSVIPNGDAAYHGIEWILGTNNLLTITATNALVPGVTFDVHIDCWTS